jgi:hypothetical protein
MLGATLAVIVVTCGGSGAPAWAAEQPVQTDRTCLSVAQANAIVRALPQSTVRKVASEDASFKISPQGSTLLIGIGTSKTAEVTVVASRGGLTCLQVPKSAHIGGLAALKASYVLAYRDAISYRSQHPWPGDRADVAAPEASVILATYGSYQLVMFSDQVRRTDAAGKARLGCGGVEYYRINAVQGEVRRFNGCVEGGVPSLPRLSQLPQ